ncbi:MAG: RIP metalloprotease RseP [Gammaproteobacteria bacterium]|nr:RIP metalloprotease RseP [Gammaproteobacteria bacterium]
MGIVITILWFLLAISILVVVHEFGHFWVARSLGVKVLRFAIGFGKPLYRWQPQGSETEYVIAALPLGGYVRMLGEGAANDDSAEPIPAEEKHRAFNHKPLWVRSLIVLAGPVFSLTLAIPLFVVMFMLGTDTLRPIVGDVIVDSPAARAGFITGDEIIAINDKTTPSWPDINMAILEENLDSDQLNIQVKTAQGELITHHLTITDNLLAQEDIDVLKILGIKVRVPPVPAVLEEVPQDQPAHKAGLQAGDRLLLVDDVAIKDWQDWQRYVAERPNQTVVVTYERNGVQQITKLHLGQHPEQKDKGYSGTRPAMPKDYDNAFTLVQYGFGESALKSVQRTYDYSLLTLRMMGRLVTGQASIKHISGPVSIADYAGQSAKMGLVYFLNFLAVVTIGLGVLNLLPIPVLDGGHLLLYAIEAVKGSPVPEKVLIVGQNIGVFLLAILMIVALHNDITRLFFK